MKKKSADSPVSFISEPDELVRAWDAPLRSPSSVLSEKDDEESKFEPGDHVIRWKIIKWMLYPIQIHGIVLSVEDEGNVADEGARDEIRDEYCLRHGSNKVARKVVIADFGYTSYEQEKKESGRKKWNGLMQSFQKKQPNSSEEEDTKNPPEKEVNTSTLHSPSMEEEDCKDLGERSGRFRIITITDPKDLKKWHKINYGSSLFSSKGKMEKIKNWFAKSTSKLTGKNRDKDDTGKSEGGDTADESGHFFKRGGEGLHSSAQTVSSSATGSTIERKRDEGGKDQMSQLGESDQRYFDFDLESPKAIEQLIAEANEIERQSRSKRFNKTSMSIKSNFSDGSLSAARTKTTRIKSPPSSPQRSPRRTPKNGNVFSMFSKTAKNTEVDANTTPYSDIHMKEANEDESNSANESMPKLPKSDPHKIVLARVQFILSQQHLPTDQSSLPPYHVLYSNSECLAVWCKTGKFSTLQAAVFLHSTAVGSAKSTFLLTAGVAASQPYLIPVVGIYGIVTVGMPYYLLSKCKIKWKESEIKLTDGFWSSADNTVFVEAIKKWSHLDSF
jgi:hypothetical protein